MLFFSGESVPDNAGPNPALIASILTTPTRIFRWPSGKYPRRGGGAIQPVLPQLRLRPDQFRPSLELWAAFSFYKNKNPGSVWPGFSIWIPS